MIGPALDVDLAALVANWRMLAARAGRAQASVVVKANAYGLGADQAAQALVKAGCQRFYVAWPHEGAALRRAVGAGPEIAVFHGPGEDLSVVSDYALEPVLNSLEQVGRWLSVNGHQAAASIHLDTGMNRLGLSESEWAEAAKLQLAPRHVLSHLACADEPANDMNTLQLQKFRQGASLWPDAKRSLAATGGVYLGRDYAFDEVRPGIGLYGGGPVPQTGPSPLPVLRLTAHILQVRDIAPGDTVGYGASWTAKTATRIATLGLGYADGFLRSASNRGQGVVCGERRRIVGRVSMDLIAIDVSGLPVKPGDEVELLGPSMLLSDQADAMGTIDYEILTRLGQRVVRTYSGGA